MILTFIQKKKSTFLQQNTNRFLFPIIKSPYISIIWPLDNSHPMDQAPGPKVTRKPLQYPAVRVNPTSENFTQENPTCQSQETRVFHLARSVSRSLKRFSTKLINETSKHFGFPFENFQAWKSSISAPISSASTRATLVIRD